MRHRVRGRRLGRNTAHRRALQKNLISALFLHGRVVTTLAKAKEYRPMAEKLVTLAREKNVHRVRRAVQVLGNKQAVQELFDRIGPAMAERPGGYTRIVKLPSPRLGDNGPRALFELVDYAPEPTAGAEAGKAGTKKAAPAST